PSLDGTAEEDSSTIDCFCGYPEDDGATVLCEICNTWQHIACYYQGTKVPEIHECIKCSPRTLDVNAKDASERQRQLREQQQSVGDRKIKKPPPKSHKKKLKDLPSNSVQTNGFAHSDRYDNYHTSDRASGSPRDQPPPAKRPKTSHKTSASVNHGSGTSGGSRLRGGSGTFSRHSPVKSPPIPSPSAYAGEYFSADFMGLHQRPEATPITTNSFTTIGVTNSLSTWLKDSDALFNATKGKTPKDLFNAMDRSIEELESSAPTVRKETFEDTSLTIGGQHPVIQSIVLDKFVPEGAYIGEFKGHIGYRDDYKQDPSNRWSTLRHPEPFVFFPFSLPIYIDARNEGNIMRYVRRSCQPNMRMKILIENERSYHFAFVSVTEISAGEELTIPWDLDETAHNMLKANAKNGIKGEENEYISNWVSCVLANFGGCAGSHPGGLCMMNRFDGRIDPRLPEPQPHALKPPKGRKRKNGNNLSPLSTGHATNSRAGSEAHKNDQDEEIGDNRSTSGSTRSKPTSRDITPMTHITDGGKGVEITDREKRKDAAAEKLFEKLNNEEQGGKRKRKRASAGSAVNTPSASASKQPDLHVQLPPRSALAQEMSSPSVFDTPLLTG
ncbi:hypothetical protein K402DRAFT_299617, partial [Aulographum hederae CBS 113979]